MLHFGAVLLDFGLQQFRPPHHLGTEVGLEFGLRIIANLLQVRMFQDHALAAFFIGPDIDQHRELVARALELGELAQVMSQPQHANRPEVLPPPRQRPAR